MNTFNSMLGITKSRHPLPPTLAQRCEPVEGDEIDELVNWQLEQGKEQRQ